MSDVAETRPSRWGFSLTSFRAKFVLVVGGAVLVDLLLAGGIALWNVNRLSTNAMQEVGLGLEKANIEYLQNYITTTVERTDLLLDRYHSEVNGLAGSMQTLIDNPGLYDKLGTELAGDGKLTTPLTYNQAGNWWQNQPGKASAVTVWGYLLDENKQPTPSALKTVRDSAAFDLFGPSMLEAGPPKLQMYYIGPRENPILRSTPYNDQGSVFDKVYPGHNETNWWDFYFPGLYETWQSWLAKPSERPVDSAITMLSPYLDGITGKIIVSFFQPLHTPDRKDLNGIVGVDLTLDQLADIVKSVKIAETGFAFLSMSNGNVLAVTEEGEKTLGVKINSEGGFDRRLAHSGQAAIASLAMPSNKDTVLTTLTLTENGEDVPYVVLLKQLDATNLYTGKVPVTREVMSLGFMVPEREIYASLIAAREGISAETRQVVTWQIGTIIVSLLIVLTAVFAISGRITAGLRALADAARRLQEKDYSVRVAIPARDEVAAVGLAFNRMAEEISYHTENLENHVTERTRALETANEEINGLNAKLKSENLRLGAELDVARHIQMMVLPRREELDEIKGIDVSGYMEPADEVGGEYF
ncbi:MAG: HAMP domain-containing protein, partial [Shinella sp.]